ncbi:MAG: 4-hydroxybenzoate octaprenyltransferase [Proteobacteria bacterium]|nr:4-hydroxybenzoate octaprenyltransferase [Pseudomonadota bacterium]MDA0844438.1 4-hydroxybenzoate octaprenyltransferase [Pseudomonadota bacterium]
MPATGWWRILPFWLHDYIYLGRFDRPIGWWLLLLPGWWVIPIGAPSIISMWWLMALFLAGSIITRAAGCIINDLWDRRLDQQVERTQQRPLASGAVSLRAAFIFLGILGAIGIGILWQLPDIAIYVGLAAAPLVIVYPLAKRVTWFPQFVLGLTFSWGVPLGWAASTGSLPDLSILSIYAGCVAWVFGYDTIYAVQDMADDAAIGIKSSALAFAQHLKIAVGVAYALALLLLSLGLYLQLGIGFWLGGLSLMGVHLAYQIHRLDGTNAAIALHLFRSNRDAGLILTATMVITRLIG